MKILLDTNILVCAYDPADVAIQERAIEIIDQLRLNKTGCLSAQCLGEFFSATTRPNRLSPPRLSPNEALQAIALLAAHYPIYPLTASTVQEAGRGVRDHGLSYYDAQIWASARLNQALVVFTEDFQPGQILEGVQFINPLATGFVLADWL